MIWIFSLVGAVIGGSIAEIAGLLTGGLFGYLFAIITIQNKRLSQLENKLISLNNALKSFTQSPIKEDPISEPTQSQAAKLKPKTRAETSLEIDDDLFLESGQLDQAQKSDHQEETPTELINNNNPWRQKATEKAPSKPTIIDKAFQFIKHYFTEGNLIVRIGIIILFFGVSFLVKYSIDHSLIALEYRIIGIILGALVMLLIGWRLRQKTPTYALLMQGGAIAIIYLAIFASFKLYDLIAAGFAFPLLIIFSLLAMTLAVLQNSRSLAITAIVGGFASPILASTGSGNYIALFGYYLVLNLSIFAVSWFKSWRLLNVVGFVFTFIVGSIWGVTEYKPENFATTEPFLISFFLIYVAIAIVFAFKQKPELKGYVDGTLIFGVPLVGFGLQAALVHKMEYGLAWSAFGLGIFYLTIAKTLWNYSNTNFRLLCESFLALGIIFATLTIPFALDGRWTAASWALEGAGFLWIGIRQQRPLVKYFGLLLQLIGAGLFLFDYPYNQEALLFLNIEFLGIAIVSIASLSSAYLLDQQTDSNHKDDGRFDSVHWFFLVWALGWWYIGGLIQVDRHIISHYELPIMVAFIIVSAILLLGMVVRYAWQRLAFFPWLLMAPLAVLSLLNIEQGHFFEHYGYLVWPLAIATAYFIYRTCEQQNYALTSPDFLQASTYLLLTLIVCFELRWWLIDQHYAESWIAVAIAMVLTMALYAINRLSIWPYHHYPKAYQLITASVLIGGLLLWSFGANFMHFLEPLPLTYIPLLNPIDISQTIILYVVINWYQKYGKQLKSGMQTQHVLMLLGGFCFIWFNVILFKTIHIMTDVAYQAEALFHSSVVQTAISISWTLIGLGIMIIASRQVRRQLWLIGSLLIGIVVIKLFLLDLAGHDSIERISSFMIVGILLLVVGYFSPVPPKKT
jgi:uncharacterized membrane protein